MRRLRLQVNRIGPHFRTVLIRGEAGTEEERVARKLHGLSPGAAGEFVRCHAGALEDALEESSLEVFRPDRLDSLTRMAEGGTLFVDGVEKLPPAAQAKLLRTLRRHESAESVGKITQRLGTRVIASTSEELKVLAGAGRFDQELYQRLATVEITLPSLRERTEDIPELVNGILDRLARFHGCPACSVSPEAMNRMVSYGWPGNMRELENLLRTIMLEREGRMIEAYHLPEFAEGCLAVTAKQHPEASMRLQHVIELHVMRVLKECGGNKLRAAERLGISRSTLYRMLDAGAAAAVSR
jgi:DNA-binding NtrC family response regulator